MMGFAALYPSYGSAVRLRPIVVSAGPETGRGRFITNEKVLLTGRPAKGRQPVSL
jgi:hypothetical protein